MSTDRTRTTAPAMPVLGRPTFRILAALLTLGAAHLAVADEVDERFDKMKAHVESCTNEYGYDARKGRRLGEHELGEAEEAWRECAYRGIEQIMIPGSAVPGAYQNLISLDKIMTREIREKKMTRKEREKRVEKLIDNALDRDRSAATRELAESEADGKTMEQRREDFIARQHEIQRMRRIQTVFR